jgi:integrase
LLQQFQSSLEGGSPTLESLAEQWLNDGSCGRWSSSTVRTYRAALRRHLLPALGMRPVRELTPEDVELYQRSLLLAGLSARTTILHRAVLSSVLRMAMRLGLINSNPLTIVRAPRSRRYRPKPFNLEEARRFLQGVAGEPLEALWILAISLGMRSGEMRALRWKDVDLSARTIAVWHSLDRAGDALVGVKSHSSVRVLPLPVAAYEALRRRKPQKAMQGDFVFLSRTGRPLDRSNVSRQFKRILRRLGFDDRRVHDLRHSCAALLIAQGLELRVIADILGHRHVRTTADLYGFVLPSTRLGAVQKLEAALARGRTASTA